MSTSQRSVPIILLKTKSSPTDPYDDQFSAPSFTSNASLKPKPIFVPVLQHKPINLDRLTHHITTNNISSTDAAAAYSGLIITSQRAVEAVGSVLAKLAAPIDLANFLATTKVYVVGPATRAAVVLLGFAENNVRGAHCGNGAVLANYILADHAAGQAPLLFLNNNRRGDVIPRTLITAPTPVALHELVLYETGVVAEFRNQFCDVMEDTRMVGMRWVVVFSSTGADVALEVLEELGGAEEGVRTFWAVIGPTTEAHLVGLGWKPEVVAKTPSPAGLWEGIDMFMAALDDRD
ncbi:tetrapyrrole biosynthesis, uroporphyrinogen III synthase [Sphaerosporella brunnea]|uniref:Tetrapyrrole biosynthesis, uroporphyrinogen III synthase n=1 Tax=Sphaerosporella brunnea TaxID=1250544 RepID=A0A5J5F3B9_9PEZI|nr:tetrapyrrole biosynthesis, uroporphyrinogen III synthase [Sphaerosporella brunnea]